MSLNRPPSIIKLNDSACFVDIPKVASSFIKSSICKSDFIYAGAGPRWPHSNLFKRPSWKSLEKVDKIICFWKDPIDRFCSVIRQKLSLSSIPKKWSPYALPMPGSFLGHESVDLLVDFMVNSPLWTLDKHLLPQSLFSANYFDYASFYLVSHLSIEQELMSLGFCRKHFPDADIALKTNSKLFNKDSMADSTIAKLQDFYASDYLLAKTFYLI